MSPEREQREPGEGLHEVDSEGNTLTVNSTDDKKAPGGYYVSQTVDGEKTTNVYDKDDNLVKSSPK